MKTTKVQTVNGIKVQHIAIENGDSKEEKKNAFNQAPGTSLIFSRMDGDDLDLFAKYFQADGIEIDMDNVKLVIEIQPDGLKI